MPLEEQRKSRGRAVLIFDLGVTWGWQVKTMPQPINLQEKAPLPIAE
jgi:hypothetical protein